MNTAIFTRLVETYEAMLALHRERKTLRKQNLPAFEKIVQTEMNMCLNVATAILTTYKRLSDEQNHQLALLNSRVAKELTSD